jgi:hypothetical protein
MQNPLLNVTVHIITTRLETVEYVDPTKSLQVCSVSFSVDGPEINVGDKFEILNTQTQYKHNFHINTLKSKIHLNYIYSIRSYCIVNI